MKTGSRKRSQSDNGLQGPLHEPIDQDLNALLARAQVAQAQGDFVTADEAYKRALAHAPGDAAIKLHYARMSFQAGNMATAELQLIEARTLEPYDAVLHFQLGLFFKAADRINEAVSSFQTAERLSPDWALPTAELSALNAGPERPVETERSPERVHSTETGRSETELSRSGMLAVPPLAAASHHEPSHQFTLFDARYYFDNNPEAAAFGPDAWTHYLNYGASAGLDPHFLFSTSHYLTCNPDVAQSGENPLLHFLRIGWRERRSFHWLFSVEGYRSHNPNLAATDDLLTHFLSFGLQENRQPHTLFQPDFYLSRYPDVADMPAFEHFLRYGDREGRAPHPLFNSKHYRSLNALKPGMPPLEHYIRANPQSNPNPLFDGAFYLRHSPGLDIAKTSPLQDYIDAGAILGKAPHPLFDQAYYLTQTDDPAAERCPLLHYLLSGAAAGLSPQPVFDPGYYRSQDRGRSWTGAALPTMGPCISVLVPVFNTPPDVLEQCIESVRGQSYIAWELCLIDDASQNDATVAMLERYRGIDKRIKVVRSTRNLHISGATNLVAEQATGEFLAFLDHDDTIAVDALAEVALAVMSRPDIDLLYTDEDKIGLDGRHLDPYHKPGWSPDHLRSVMYVLHLLVIRKSLFWKLDGLRAERSGAQDYDLALRASRLARHVHHIPRILYHWRMIPGSAAAAVDAKPYALNAARSAVQDVVAAAGLQATVEDGLLAGTFRVRYSLAANPPVTLLLFTNNSDREVPGRGRINLVRHFLRSIAEKSTYANIKLVVVDNANTPLETRKLIKEMGGEIVSYKLESTFSYASKANFATRSVATEHVVYLNDDLEVISPGWIEALLELLQVPDIGGVGGRLLYPNGTVQHSGVVLGVHGGVGHAFWSLPADAVGYAGYTHMIRNYSAVSGAVFATRKSVMEAVNGFDESFRIDYNDIDLCLRMIQRGYRTAFTPYCELYHFEGSTQIRTTQAPDEIALFHNRWQGLVDADPYYNPNLPRDRFTFG